MVKKFKKGTVVLSFDEVKNPNDVDFIDRFVNGDMFWNDLYIDFIEDGCYMFDTNKGLVYDLDCQLNNGYPIIGNVNALRHLENCINEARYGKLRLYPMPKREGNKIFDMWR